MAGSFFSNLESLKRTFPTIEISDRPLSSYFYIVIAHGKEVNRTIRDAADTEYVSVISFGYLNEGAGPFPPRVPIHLYINFARKEQSDFPITMFEHTKDSYCPENVEIDPFCYWVPSENLFVDAKNRPISLEKRISRLYKSHCIPLRKWAGLLTRVGRFVTWKVEYNLLWYLSQIFKAMHLLVSGKKVGVKSSGRLFDYVFGSEKVEIEFTESSELKIDFYGMKVNIVPLLTYSAVHLVAYFLYKIFGIELGMFHALFTNPFLTVMYVIVTLGMMTYGIGALFGSLYKACLNSVKAIQNGWVPKFGRKKYI